MAKSIQRIEDFYLSRGYKRSALRKILWKDKEYQRLLDERKQKLTKRFAITKTEEKKYAMSTDEDYEILYKIKQLGKLKLNAADSHLVKLIRSQLEHDWRRPLIKEIERIMRRYR
ncbi:hypothetical protein HYU11_03900 [Candidatus Woesearchaeota archaeon]|nr:hypothetical protein [Candidatus Woesearchaeota archaeon]